MLGNLHRTLFVIVITLPLLGQAFLYPGSIPLFLPFAILLAPATALLRISDEGVAGLLVGDSAFMAISAVTVLTYIYGVLISIEFQGQSILREIANGIVAMMVVFSIANSSWTATDRNKLVNTLAWAMLVTGVFVSVLGAWKFWLFVSTGERLDFVVAGTGTVYPWGTSLVTDYNFYALTILVAILSAMFLYAERGPMIQVTLALAIVGMIAVGSLAGSRRFWVVTPVFIGLQALWMVSRSGIRRYSVLFSTLVLCLVGMPIAVLNSADDSIWRNVGEGLDLQIRFMSIFDSSRGFGTVGRFEYWYIAVDRLEGMVPWIGSGFDYLTRFSCQYFGCIGTYYPHMPILSAYLYGGWIAAIAALALYAYITVAGFRLLKHGTAVAWLFFPMMAAFFFAAISANGPLSIRSHIVLAALCIGFLREANADVEFSQRSVTVGE